MANLIQTKLKGQVLVLVLIIVGVALVVVLAIGTRVVNELQEVGLERASTRAGSFAESAIDNVKSKIENGEALSERYNLGSSGNGSEGLDICNETGQNVENQCSNSSFVTTQSLNVVQKFSLNNSESLEAYIAAENANSSNADQTEINLYFDATNNNTVDTNASQLLVRAYYFENNVLKIAGECMWTLQNGTATCTPGLTSTDITCQNTSAYGNDCTQIKSNNPAAFYRVKALLRPQGGATNPHIAVSVTGPNGTDLPQTQLIYAAANVYVGETFRSLSTLTQARKMLPEFVDYVIYNGSNQPISK